jgi:hypothetical protein
MDAMSGGLKRSGDFSSTLMLCAIDPAERADVAAVLRKCSWRGLLVAGHDEDFSIFPTDGGGNKLRLPVMKPLT